MKINRCLLTTLLISSLLYFSCTSYHIDQPEITVEELQETIGFLASDSLKGRYPGTTEDSIMADYLVKKFREMGIMIMAKEGQQYFEIVTSIKAGENNSLKYSNTTLELNKDFAPFSFSGNAITKAKVAFVGYGFEIDDEDLKWNDYSDIDVTDKWLIILRGDPEIDSLTSSFIPYSGDRDKVMLASDHGAAGVLFVSGPKFDQKDKLVDLETQKAPVDIPVFQITRNVADDILKGEGRNIEKLEEKLNKQYSPEVFETGIIVRGLSEVLQDKSKTRNIISMIKGNDPDLADEYILIGGHHDHLGMGGPNTGSRKPDTTAVHNGADDNASGVAAVLEIAEKLSYNRDSLRRSIIFTTFGAEEMGLLGSKYFVNNPVVPIEKISAMINIDMVGRLNNEKLLQIGGTATSVSGAELLDNITGSKNFSLAKSPEGYGPSDHASFYGKNIPVFFFSTGPHLDFHMPEDDIEQVNFEGLKSVSDYIYYLTYELVNRDSSLVFKEAGPKTGQQRTKRQKGVTLGIMPDFAGQVKNGLRADFVLKDRPAYKGGMKNGDIIIAINGKAINSIYDYMYRLEKLKQGQTITVEVMRDNEKKVLLIQL
ncbi:MAG: M20/M25/M40 family metallo-hydrolase [Bacteroidales bacterium]|nr:M20/M25/M40 family metallo-hydrolase [Bacteroidales bacterium]